MQVLQIKWLQYLQDRDIGEIKAFLHLMHVELTLDLSEIVFGWAALQTFTSSNIFLQLKQTSNSHSWHWSIFELDLLITFYLQMSQIWFLYFKFEDMSTTCREWPDGQVKRIFYLDSSLKMQELQTFSLQLLHDKEIGEIFCNLHLLQVNLTSD